MRNHYIRRINKNAGALVKIKINQFKECAWIQSKLLTNNKTDNENQELGPEHSYSKVESINKQKHISFSLRKQNAKFAWRNTQWYVWKRH